MFTILPGDLNMSFSGFGFGADASHVSLDEPTLGPVTVDPLLVRALGIGAISGRGY